MKSKLTLVLSCFCLSAAILSCDNKIPIPDDVSGISLKNIDVLVEYTEATVSGEISVSQRPERISEVVVRYGDKTGELTQSVKATFDAKSFSANLASLVDGTQYYYSVDVIVGKTSIPGETKDFITFPKGPIDLDLPSGKKWASHNVGAKIPTDRGDHFAWGETEKKELYNWPTYMYCDGDYKNLTKYTVDPTYTSSGVPDNLVNLQSGDDAARVNMGEGWRTPTKEEWIELIDNCACSEIVINGVQGKKLSSIKDANNNKKFIFLVQYPGLIDGTDYNDTGSKYWTATVNSGYLANMYAYVITAYVGGGFITNLGASRCCGLPVRAIYDSE